MHVARTDLQRVGIVRDDGDIGGVHHLGDDGQADFVADAAQDFEALLAVPGKAIGAGARLERTGAQRRGARRLYRFGAIEHLLVAFDGTRTRDDRQRGTADRHRVCAAADMDDGVVRMRFAADELVWGEDRLDRFDHRVAVEVERGEHPFVAERAEDDAFGAGHMEWLQPCIADPRQDVLRFGVGGFGSEDDDHGDGS